MGVLSTALPRLFLAASSSSRSLDVSLSVCLFFCLLGYFVKILPIKYQMVTKSYLKPIYLPTYATVVTVVTVVTLVKVVTVVTVMTAVTKKNSQKKFHKKIPPKKTFFTTKVKM